MYFYRYFFPTKVTTFFSPLKNCDLLPENSPHVKEFRPVLDSGFLAVDSGFQVFNSSVGFRLGFRIPIVSEILGSSNWIPDSKVQDSGFHKQQFPRFQNPNSLTWGGENVAQNRLRNGGTSRSKRMLWTAERFKKVIQQTMKLNGWTLG